jgi:hypothetical protein
VQAGWSTVRLVDSINSCHPLEVEGEKTAVQAGWSTVRFVDSINS